MLFDTVTTLSEDETVQLGKKFAGKLTPGDVVALYGELGSGKTEFVKGVADFFNVEEIVASPTFNIINQYNGQFPTGRGIKLYHLDLFRIDTAQKLAEVGFDECMDARDSIKLIEWSEKSQNHLPKRRFEVKIDPCSEDINKREITIVLMN